MENGAVNRDGIGAVIRFTPENGQTVTIPVQGGSSHLSQHSLEMIFGLGTAQFGVIEVVWPGGTRNRLYDVQSSERIVFPEIPCSFDADWGSSEAYQTCLEDALNELISLNVISVLDKDRFLQSGLKAFEGG